MFFLPWYFMTSDRADANVRVRIDARPAPAGGLPRIDFIAQIARAMVNHDGEGIVLPRAVDIHGQHHCAAPHRFFVDGRLFVRDPHFPECRDQTAPAAPMPRPVSSVTRAPPARMGPTPGITSTTSPAIRPTPPPNEAPAAAAAPVLVDASFAFSRYSLWRLASLPATMLMFSRGIPRFFRSRSVRSASTSDVNTPTIVLMQSYLPISGCTARANGAIDTVSFNQENRFMRNTVLACV